MKKIMLTAMLALVVQFTFAQCLEDVTGFGNNVGIPMYNVSGTVEVTLNTDETITLDLGADFMTASGPDIRAFLVNSNGLSDAQLANTQIGNLENLQFGLVGSNTINQNGAKSFTIDIPSGTDIQDFDKVFFYCLQFNQFWDFGSYTPYSSSTCSIILSVNDTDLTAVTVWPNPSSGSVQMSTANYDSLSVKIYNSLGSLVQEQDTVQNNEVIDVSNLTSGIYLVEVSENQSGTSKTQRLVIK